jgi:hypothetical protein
MKLFITNKSVFENTIDGTIENNEKILNSHLIHKKAFTDLFIEVTSKNSIPILITIDINDAERYAFFKFISYKNDVYFYEFQSE